MHKFGMVDHAGHLHGLAPCGIYVPYMRHGLSFQHPGEFLREAASNAHQAVGAGETMSSVIAARSFGVYLAVCRSPRLRLEQASCPTKTTGYCESVSVSMARYH
jgi:hypothetical protein